MREEIYHSFPPGMALFETRGEEFGEDMLAEPEMKVKALTARVHHTATSDLRHGQIGKSA
jgi:hypothetical protein